MVCKGKDKVLPAIGNVGQFREISVVANVSVFKC